jgi:uncharacterized protein (TIGR02452 family)
MKKHEFVQQSRQALEYTKNQVIQEKKLSQFHVFQFNEFTEKSDHVKKVLSQPDVTEHKLEFYADDTFNVVQRLIDRKLNPVGMNMASVFKPGGGWLNGSLAQEESLFYRSTYNASLPQHVYPLKNKLVYSPYVEVFKDSDYERLNRSKRFTCSMIAVAALKTPALECGRLSWDDYNKTMNMIRNFCIVASLKGHDSIVFGALGCGAYMNPVPDIAYAFKQVLYGEGWATKFKVIAFGILPGRLWDPLPTFEEIIDVTYKVDKFNTSLDFRRGLYMHD